MVDCWRAPDPTDVAACRYGLNEPAIADRLEKVVNQVLDAGFRTGDIMAENCQQISCSEMGKKLQKFIEDA